MTLVHLKACSNPPFAGQLPYAGLPVFWRLTPSSEVLQMNPNNPRSPTLLPAVTEEPWFGKSRASMNTNVLIQHVDSGKIKRTTFATPPEDKVFGASRPQDPEGAREGTALLPDSLAFPAVPFGSSSQASLLRQVYALFRLANA